MKQAIQEGFILDILAHYTPVESYYKPAKTMEDDSEIQRQQGTEETAALRRGARARYPSQDRDHGGPLPQAGAGLGQDRRAIVAFSDEHEFGGNKMTEANINGFPSG